MLSLSNHLRQLRTRRDGNFAMMTAIVLPVLVGGAGLAVDLANVMLSQRQLQEATDAAALAVSTALADGKADETSGKTLAKDFVGGQMANYLSSADTAAVKTATNTTITTTTSGTSKSFAVTVSSSSTVALTPLMSLFAGKSMAVTASSKTTSGAGSTRNGLSMELLLDESGSMADDTTTVKSTRCVISILGTCIYQTTYVTKIEALKQAATTLFDALDKADPSARYVRTGTISYTNGIKGQSAVAWGTTGSRTYVNNMPQTPTGGTDATSAVNTATAAIKKNGYGTDTESVEQMKKNNANSDRVIILMTDGEMTGNTITWSKTLDQSVRNECAAAKSAGITIYTVAFMAPDNGKSLLRYCASSSNNYYEPNTMDGLVAAFASIAETATKAVSRLTN